LKKIGGLLRRWRVDDAIQRLANQPEWTEEIEPDMFTRNISHARSKERAGRGWLQANENR
jgi:hypothetical protein